MVAADGTAYTEGEQQCTNCDPVGYYDCMDVNYCETGLGTDTCCYT